MINKIRKSGNITKVNYEDIYNLEVTREDLAIINDAISLYNDKLIKDYNRVSLSPSTVEVKGKQLYLYNKVCNLKSHIDNFLRSLAGNSYNSR